MTRESQRLTEEQDGDAEIFSALWRAAPSFPQLPPDAPQQLKALTIDVDDPKKVYSIHRASRRHGFQILVERYANQLRYGCQDPRCNTPTCFTCRRRLAGTPVRPYNATSARTLACYLASQDNPEKGLCQYIGVPQSKIPTPTRLRVSSKSSLSVDGAKNVQWSTRSPKTSTQVLNNGGSSGQTPPAGLEGSLPGIQHAIPNMVVQDSSKTKEDDDLEYVRSVVRVLNEPVKTDHKSFIQNIFGTVAFRMLEWLTPKNLESMISPDARICNMSQREYGSKIDQSSQSQSNVTPDTGHLSSNEKLPELESPSQKLRGQIQQNSGHEAVPDSVARSACTLDGHTCECDSRKDEAATSLGSGSAIKGRYCSRDVMDAAAQLPPPKNINGSVLHDIPDRSALELGVPRSAHINGPVEDPGSPKPGENQVNTHIKNSRRRPSSLSTSRPPISYQESFDPEPSIPQIAKHASISKNLPSVSSSDANQDGDEERLSVRLQQQRQNPSTQQPLLEKGLKASPQSLSVLPLEVIDFIGSLLREDEMRGPNASSMPSPYPEAGLRRACETEAPNKVENGGQILIRPMPAVTPMWTSFVDQSLFYVLSSPKALLQSFSGGGQSLVDTQTLWYCMMRLIRARSSLVFDSLWIAAADLYIPPRELWSIYDWAKKPRIYEGGGSVDYTSDEAARLISICLHALIAAVPYTADAGQLLAMSRIRSYGLSSLQRRGISSELVNLYLAIDDVFSDDLTLRLARRLFAAIPARRQYQELLKLNENGCVVRPSIPDILDLVLAPLNFLNIEVPPILDFTQEDRALHEKRAPILMIDWARTIMLQDWTGRAEVSVDGAFGGALAMMSAIYEKRKSLPLGDVHFRTEYFADRLDSMEMPVEWLSFTPNKKTLHLLDYPYLFSPANLVTYFRAINFSRMSRSFEASNSTLTRIQTTMAPGTLIDTRRREDIFERLRTAVSRFLVLQIRRSDVLADAFDHIWRREKRELFRPLKIRLGEDSGEEGSDSGGVQQEFFRLAIAEALSPDYGAFTVDERTRMIWFQPGSPLPLWRLELIGLIMSLAVYNGLTLPVTFPKALYRKLLGAPVTELHHIADGWPELASGLTTLLEWEEKDGSVRDVFSRTYEFSIDSFGKQISRDMSAGTQWPQFHEPAEPNPVDSRLVDSENRNEYVSDYILWLTDISIRPQFEAFQRGFFTCLERRSLSLFDPEILQSVVEGIQEIDISELRRFTRYVGWDASHRTIKDFWSIVKKFDGDEKRRLLEFVTASDRVPVGGMRNLQFVVQRNGIGDIDGHLPTSYTCYGTLLLPEYSTKEILKDKLGMALENAKGFGFA